MEAHFISVNDSNILKQRAARRENLGGHSSEIKSIDKTYQQSFGNFVSYISKLKKATIWDNSEEYGITKMQPQFIYENGTLSYQNPAITSYANGLLDYAKLFLAQNPVKGIEIWTL